MILDRKYWFVESKLKEILTKFNLDSSRKHIRMMKEHAKESRKQHINMKPAIVTIKNLLPKTTRKRISKNMNHIFGSVSKTSINNATLNKLNRRGVSSAHSRCRSQDTNSKNNGYDESNYTNKLKEGVTQDIKMTSQINNPYSNIPLSTRPWSEGRKKYRNSTMRCRSPQIPWGEDVTTDRFRNLIILKSNFLKQNRATLYANGSRNLHKDQTEFISFETTLNSEQKMGNTISRTGFGRSNNIIDFRTGKERKAKSKLTNAHQCLKTFSNGKIIKRLDMKLSKTKNFMMKFQQSNRKNVKTADFSKQVRLNRSYVRDETVMEILNYGKKKTSK